MSDDSYYFFFNVLLHDAGHYTLPETYATKMWLPNHY